MQQPIIGVDGQPITSKKISYILQAKQFCAINGCEAFRILTQVMGKQGNPFLILCVTCKNLIRDNDVPRIFCDQNGIVDPKLAVKKDGPDGHSSDSTKK